MYKEFIQHRSDCEENDNKSIDCKKYIDRTINKLYAELLSEIYCNQGIPGKDGRQGIKGDKGDKGDPFGQKGEPGSVPSVGVGEPNPNFGNDDEVFIDAATGNIFVKINGLWIFQGNLKGPKGEPGELCQKSTASKPANTGLVRLASKKENPIQSMNLAQHSNSNSHSYSNSNSNSNCRSNPSAYHFLCIFEKISDIDPIPTISWFNNCTNSEHLATIRIVTIDQHKLVTFGAYNSYISTEHVSRISINIKDATNEFIINTITNPSDPTITTNECLADLEAALTKNINLKIALDVCNSDTLTGIIMAVHPGYIVLRRNIGNNEFYTFISTYDIINFTILNQLCTMTIRYRIKANMVNGAWVWESNPINPNNNDCIQYGFDAATNGVNFVSLIFKPSEITANIINSTECIIVRLTAKAGTSYLEGNIFNGGNSATVPTSGRNISYIELIVETCASTDELVTISGLNAKHSVNKKNLIT
jgi:hypothetical protein